MPLIDLGRPLAAEPEVFCILAGGGAVDLSDGIADVDELKWLFKLIEDGGIRSLPTEGDL